MDIRKANLGALMSRLLPERDDDQTELQGASSHRKTSQPKTD